MTDDERPFTKVSGRNFYRDYPVPRLASKNQAGSRQARQAGVAFTLFYATLHAISWSLREFPSLIHVYRISKISSRL